MSGINKNTKFISHWNGQNGGKEIIDDGNIGFVTTQVATAQLDALIKKIGNTSLKLDGNSDFITTGTTSDFKFLHGADNPTGFTFSLESWIKIPMLAQQDLFYTKLAGTPLVGIETFIAVDGSIRLDITHGVGGQFIVILNAPPGTYPSDGLFHHIGFTYDQSLSSNNATIFLDGTIVAQGTKTANAPSTANSDQPLTFGIRNLSIFFEGNADEIRVSDNIRWTSNFTPQTTPYVSDANTRLLQHLDSHDISGEGGSNVFHIPTFMATSQLDTAIKKFGSASLFLDGNSDFILVPDSPDWDLVGSNLDSYTIDLHVRHVSTGVKEVYMSQLESPNDHWALFKNSSDELEFVVVSGGVTIINLKGGNISSGSFVHVALTKIKDEYGLYIAGTQVAFTQDSSTDTFTASLRIGSLTSFTEFFGGNLDEVRIQKSNIFGANPNVGITDTIIVPTEEFTVEIPADIQTDTKFDPITGKLRKENNLGGRVFIDYFTGQTFLKIRED